MNAGSEVNDLNASGRSVLLKGLCLLSLSLRKQIFKRRRGCLASVTLSRKVRLSGEDDPELLICDPRFEQTHAQIHAHCILLGFGCSFGFSKVILPIIFPLIFVLFLPTFSTGRFFTTLNESSADSGRCGLPQTHSWTKTTLAALQIFYPPQLHSVIRWQRLDCVKSMSNLNANRILNYSVRSWAHLNYSLAPNDILCINIWWRHEPLARRQVVLRGSKAGRQADMQDLQYYSKMFWNSWNDIFF